MVSNWGRVVRVMSKPQKHPKTDVLRLRWAVPRELQERVAAVLGRTGRTRELIRTLSTRDPREAKAPLIEAERWANGILEAARKGAKPLDGRHVHALAGLWYQRTLAEWEANPEAAAAWDGHEDGAPGPISNDGTDPAEPPPLRWERAYRRWIEGMLPAAADLLASEGVVTDPASEGRLAELLNQRLAQARAVHGRRLSGDYGPDPLPSTFPAPPVPPPAPATAAPSAPGVSLMALWEAWKAVASVKPSTVTGAHYAVDMLGAFLGHSDAARITRDDVRRWRDASKAEGLVNNTWNNRLSLMRQVFAFAVSDGRLNENPADNSLRLPKSKAATRLPYSDDEAARILLAARREAVPTRRWAHWIMAFSGMRVGEVLQLTRGDVRREGDVWFLAVHEDDAGKSVKTGQRRNVPVHPALIAEGFIDYVATVTGDAPLFRDKALDRHGNRGGRGWNAVGKWVRTVAKVMDPQKAPNHSWRHRVEDELRAAEVSEDVRDAIVGHARKTTGRSYGIRGEALTRLYQAVCRIPSPLAADQQPVPAPPQAA